MLKYGESLLLPCILKIFNSILQLGIYLKEWKMGYLNPICKSGVRSDPSNYRGITKMSCIGKLFNSLLNTCTRLYEYLTGNYVISKRRLAFRRKQEPLIICLCYAR